MTHVPPPGSLIQLQGLVAKPELNGKRGTVLPADHSPQATEGYANGRVPVLLSGGGTLLLKPAALAPVDPKAYDAMCERACLLFTQRKFQEAVGELKQAIALQPEIYTAYFQIGQIYEVMEDAIQLDGAKQAWRKVRHETPSTT